MSIKKKKSFVSATEKARVDISEAVSVLYNIAISIRSASQYLLDEAANNRTIAESLIDEAEGLEIEAARGANIASTIESLTLSTI